MNKQLLLKFVNNESAVYSKQYVLEGADRAQTKKNAIFTL